MHERVLLEGLTMTNEKEKKKIKGVGRYEGTYLARLSRIKETLCLHFQEIQKKI